MKMQPQWTWRSEVQFWIEFAGACLAILAGIFLALVTVMLMVLGAAGTAWLIFDTIRDRI